MELFYIPGMKLEEVEKRVILHALRIHRGNQTRTADSLGISAKTLYAKLKAYEEKDENKGSKHPGSKDKGRIETSEPGDANPV